MQFSANAIGLAGWFHLVYFGVVLPLSARRQAKRLLASKQALPNRLRHFQAASVTIVMLTLLSLLVARAEWIDLFPRELPSWGSIAAGLGMYVIAVAVMRPRWRAAVERRTPIVHLFMPDNAKERAWWIGVSTCAGIGEEITWRGVQAMLIVMLGGSFWLAALISAASFGATHLIQGRRSAAIITAFALGFHALVWISGSLYVAMAVHVAYDITAGITYGRLGRQLGYANAPAPTKPGTASV